MANYNPKSLNAEEFINDGEILETLRYAEENKNNGDHYGLGLAICKTLCKKLDGEISCRNNNGAEVTVEI